MLAKLSDRNIGIIGTLLGVVGLVLSIYFYYASIAERRPIFLLDDTSRSVIASRSEIPQSAIAITRSDGKPISGDVNVAKFYFWNDGAVPIRQDEILKPVRLRVEGGEILSFKLISSTRDVVGAAISRSGPNSLDLNAKILERSDGFVGQIVYEGPRNARVLIDGVILGVGEIEFCSCVVPQRPWQLLSSAAMYVALLTVALLQAYKTWKDRARINRLRVLAASLLSLIFFAGIGYSLLSLYKLSKISAEPPATLMSPPKNRG